MVATWYLRRIASSQSACFSVLRAYEVTMKFVGTSIFTNFGKNYKTIQATFSLSFHFTLCLAGRTNRAHVQPGAEPGGPGSQGGRGAMASSQTAMFPIVNNSVKKLFK